MSRVRGDSAILDRLTWVFLTGFVVGLSGLLYLSFDLLRLVS